MTAEPRNIPELLQQRAAAAADKIFLFSEADKRQFTYNEFVQAVARAAGMLAARGIGGGDGGNLLLPNSVEYIIAYFACWQLGALAGPVNGHLKEQEIAYVVANSESKLMLVNSEFLSKVEGGRVPFVVFDNEREATEGFSGSKAADIGLEDEAIIIYTSGTSGKPKGCLLTHGNVIANARQISEWLGFTESDRLLTIMPLFHMNAVSVTTLSMLLSTYADGVPAGLQTDQLRFAMCGSAPVPAEVLRRFEETFNCLVVEGYGLSESTCRSTFNPPDKRRRPGSCGLPIGNEMRVVDEDDQAVADGELGEIVLRGENILKGYFKNEAATTTAFRNGWFHTGDIGYRDADGFYFIVDRKSDMIIRGGENIYPREIDEVLYQHPQIAAAAVIGVPDELYGEDVAAVVVLKDDAKVSEEEVIEFCKARLADYKCPKTVRFVADIPKGPTGKLLKRELAQMFR